MATTWGPEATSVNGSCSAAGAWDAGDAWFCGNAAGTVYHGGTSFLYDGATITKADTINSVYVTGVPNSAKTIKVAVRLQSGNWLAFSATNKPSDATWANERATVETSFVTATSYFGSGQTREIDLATDLATAIDADAGDQLENGDYINVCLWSDEDTENEGTNFSAGTGETLTIEWTAAAGGGVNVAVLQAINRRRRG